MNVKILLFEQIIIILTLCIYLSGFMGITKNAAVNPTKNVEYKNMTDKLYKESPVKKTIIMIIDGLRPDHLVSSNDNLMEFSSGLMKSGKGFGYTVHTETPTVTLPRIKSLLTGTIPGFMDVIFNFASKELTDQNLVQFWKNSGLRTRFYGDDTWLGLFPDVFDQWKGVTSFYVSDFVQVDTNVTEQLTASLPQDAWDVMILHYLGLDHIGHIAGPNSDLVPPKLREMDSIIQHIYNELELKNETYLLLVCGDHGMSDGGGHGGASASEIMTSAMLVSNIFKSDQKVLNRMVHQVDLASTLAILTGVAIPNKNIGTPVVPVLDSLPHELKLLAEHQLTDQLVANALSYLKDVENEVLKSGLSTVSKKHQSLVRSCGQPSTCPHYVAEAAKISNTYASLRTMASVVLDEHKQSYDMFLVLLAVFAIFVVSVSRLLNEVLINLRSQEHTISTMCWTICIFLFVTIYLHGTIINAFIISISLSFGIERARRVFSTVRPVTMLQLSAVNFTQLVIFSFVLLHPLSLLATSFVEEEHQVFYFILSSLHCVFLASLLRRIIASTNSKAAHVGHNSNSVGYVSQLFDGLRSLTDQTGCELGDNKVVSLFVALVSWLLFRYLRYFNATGDKWRQLLYYNNILANLPSSVSYPILLTAFIFSIVIYSPFMAFSGIAVELVTRVPSHSVKYVYRLGTQFGPYPLIFLVFCTNLAMLMPRMRRILGVRKVARVGECSNLSRFIFCFEGLFALLFVVIQKKENYLCTLVSLVHFRLLLELLVRFGSSLGLSSTYSSIVVFWLADGHFFAHGNSNSLTTVRIAAGFVGITTYSPVIHGLLIFVHTFGSKIIIYLHFIRLSVAPAKDRLLCASVLRCWWMMQLIVLNVYIFVVTIQRHHLFIWTVFAPKLLYEGCNVICLFVVTIVCMVASTMTQGVDQRLII